MPGCFVQLDVADVRRDNRQIAISICVSRSQRSKRIAQHRAVRFPQRQTFTDQRANREQAQLLTDDTMIALLGLFQQIQIILQVFRCFPGRAVNARQLFAVFIATPIGSRDRLKCDADGIRIDFLRVLDMRPATQIRERILRLERDFLGR